MRTTLFTLIVLHSSVVQAEEEIELWPDQAPPYSKSVEDKEFVDDCWGGVRCAHNVTKPTLTLYPTEAKSQSWGLVAPGGGYDVVAIFHEGAEIAEGFVKRGIPAAVLKYRIPDNRTATKPEKVPFADFRRAMTAEEQQGEVLLDWVSESTPPAFLVHAVDDEVSPYTESTLYAEALRDKGVDAELHLFARGGHGFGSGRDEDGTSQWLDLAVNWVKRLDGQ